MFKGEGDPIPGLKEDESPERSDVDVEEPVVDQQELIAVDGLEEAAAATSLGGVFKLRFDHHLFSSDSSEKASFDINRSNQDHEIDRMDAHSEHQNEIMADIQEEATIFESVQENQTNEDTFDFRVILDFSVAEKTPELSAKQKKQLKMEEDR